MTRFWLSAPLGYELGIDRRSDVPIQSAVEMLSEIRQLQPQPCWFIIAPAVAVALVKTRIVLASLAGVAAPNPLYLLLLTGHASVDSLINLPLGLWGIFIRNLGLYHEYRGVFCYAGWSVYLVLIAAGLEFPRRKLFLVLVLLLLLDVIGYPAESIRQHVEDSLMW